jgi:hypothetical protein
MHPDDGVPGSPETSVHIYQTTNHLQNPGPVFFHPATYIYCSFFSDGPACCQLVMQPSDMLPIT